MAKKPISGILKLVDDLLETNIAAKAPAPPRGSVTLTKRPTWTRSPEPTNVHPDVLRGLTDPNPMGGTFERGVSLNTYPPFERMFHATNRRLPFDHPTGDISDVGLHLSASPNVTDFYALTQDTKDIPLLEQAQQGVPGITLAGPRTYPLLVDPGNKFTGFPVDAGHWNDPKSVASQAFDQVSDEDLDTDMLRILNKMAAGTPVPKAFLDQGFDSVEYPHINFYHPRSDPQNALMLFDPSRAIPEYSYLGGQAKKARGVLYDPIPSDMPSEPEEILGAINSDAGSLDEALGNIYDPRPKDMSDELRSLKWEYEEIATTDEEKGWLIAQMDHKMKVLTELDPKLAKFIANNMPEEIAFKWGGKE